MFNKYYFSFIYFCWFVLCMCIHIYVHIFIYYVQGKTWDHPSKRTQKRPNFWGGINSSVQFRWGVCCFVLLNRYWGIITVPGLPRVNRPQTTWGGQILTLHLNYVAGYTNPLLFLFERTQPLTPSTTRGKPWRLHAWAGPKFVRSHRWGPWVMKRFLGYWGPRNCEILHLPRPSKPNQHLFF